MTTFLACESLSATLGSLFVCSEHGEYQRIRTPYLYPDGDNIDLFCKMTGETVTVTDLGETTRWLRMQSVSPRRSPKQQAILEDICQNHGVEFYRGMVLAAPGLKMILRPWLPELPKPHCAYRTYGSHSARARSSR